MPIVLSRPAGWILAAYELRHLFTYRRKSPPLLSREPGTGRDDSCHWLAGSEAEKRAGDRFAFQDCRFLGVVPLLVSACSLPRVLQHHIPVCSHQL